MFIGTLRLELYMPQCGSLKEKRQVIKSIIDRTHSRFNVAIAEVGKNDLWQVSSLGVACVGNSELSVRRTLGQVNRSIMATGKAEILESPLDIQTS
ncbi:MAG: DUF503 domain-containing protein [Actinomycetota bacterium]|nr:DUF503 domain-containing protein [Actinomycetota bacterium]